MQLLYHFSIGGWLINHPFSLTLHNGTGNLGPMHIYIYIELTQGPSAFQVSSLASVTGQASQVINLPSFGLTSPLIRDSGLLTALTSVTLAVGLILSFSMAHAPVVLA